MSMAFQVVTLSIKTLTRLLCRVDAESLQRVPSQGPLILVCNHINFMDAPLVFTHLQPRPVTGFAKSETWDSPLLGPLFNLWGAIPVRRGDADMKAIHMGLEALRQGKILAIAPEGTRSGHGRLQKGHPGVVFMATHSGAPLLPMVYYGGETLQHNLRRMRRTNFHIRVGHPFTLAIDEKSITRQIRQEITDEIMYQLAGLLPPAYRGAYHDLEAGTTQYLKFLKPVTVTS